ncbi:MAG: hypothetical protein GX763_09365, partial [Clostridiaceae bacterium]|nr:hypothetical protein [Clostridiaceae bacterium]
MHSLWEALEKQEKKEVRAKMLSSFTRNYEDNSTAAGFEFTFYCDICNDGFRSSFIESETYKKGKNLRGLSQG